jgi:hypothetical protein
MTVFFDESVVHGQDFLLNDAPSLELAEESYAIELGVKVGELEFGFFD